MQFKYKNIWPNVTNKLFHFKIKCLHFYHIHSLFSAYRKNNVQISKYTKCFVILLFLIPFENVAKIFLFCFVLNSNWVRCFVVLCCFLLLIVFVLPLQLSILLYILVSIHLWKTAWIRSCDVISIDSFVSPQ